MMTYTLPVVGGILFTLGFAPLFWWPLALVGLAILFHLVRTKKPLGQLFWWGFAHYVTSLYWMPRSFMIDAGGNWWPAFYAGMPALIAVCCILAGGVVLLAYITRKFPPVWQPFVFIFGWIFGEWLRTLQPLQFPWNPAGMIFTGNDLMIQTAALGGIWGLTLCVLLCGWALSHKGKRALVAPLVLVAMVSYGQMRTHSMVSTGTQGTYRLVQANVSTAVKWRDAERETHLNTHIHLMDAANNPQIDGFIWPETAVAYAVADDVKLQHTLADKLLPHQTLTLGFLRWEDAFDAPRKYFNSMSTLNASGTLSPFYDKHLLVPFGETLPFPSITQKILRTLSFNRGTFWAGEQPAQLQVGGLTALPLICYEAIFSNFVQQELATQTFLLQITNDNWFDGTSAPHQHLAMARLRAVETGLPLVRVANTGVTVLVDGYGRIVKRLPIRTVGVLDVAIPNPVPAPFYVRAWGKLR